jgi:hypothetical protein
MDTEPTSPLPCSPTTAASTDVDTKTDPEEAEPDTPEGSVTTELPEALEFPTKPEAATPVTEITAVPDT